MIILGITGGIGSGKSYVTRIFGALGIPYYDSDNRTKQLYLEQPKLKKELSALLGESIFTNEGLDTQRMAKLIFSNRELLKKVNFLVHPYVVRDFLQWAKPLQAPYVIFESAILLEMDPPFHTTRVLTVSASREIRLRRAAGRDAVHRQSVLDRMDKQWTDVQREAGADFVIESNDRRALLPRVLEVHQTMLNIRTTNNEN
ncbi:MAG: dephospho-CoA kinase [Bacteroidales bacterium]|jgi:dephospho-CoA kinase|nr:dephospho-CoA kinase [Bacteroidales bacterium]NLK79291.1 dephospho-CoA kinase [Bacteroidales bacterium]HKM31269.1 dephospho-CoA kinase [Bacteroidales bacterium]HPX79132.1 dephospho-CoA kinase [Bacteroidales bacterium]